MEKTLKEAIEKNRQAMEALEQALKDCLRAEQGTPGSRDEAVKLRLISGGRKE